MKELDDKRAMSLATISSEIGHSCNFAKTNNFRIVEVDGEKVLQQLMQCQFCHEHQWFDVEVVQRPRERVYE